MSLQLTNVTKKFKNNRVLDDVSLHVQKGETLVLFGPSGAGKTVLLQLIAGVIDPDEGSIIINGMNMKNIEPEDRGIGMAFQNFALFPHMDAHTNIAAPLTARKSGRSIIDASVASLAKLLKIDHVLSHKPGELSNGQKQRTALARALAGEPSLLLLDDPLRNVDAQLRFAMRLELPRLLKNRKTTVLYVTQDYKEAMALGDRIAILNNYGIQQYGTPEDIYLRPAHTEIARLFGDPVINLIDVLPTLGRNGVEVRIADQVLTIGKDYTNNLSQACIVGIRPEAITFVKKSAKNALPVEVKAITPLNEKTVCLTRTPDGNEIMVSRPAGADNIAMGKAYIQVNVKECLLFNKANGNRITRVVSQEDRSIRVC